MALYIGNMEIRGDSIGVSSHEGRDGWTFTPHWSPGDGEEKLKQVLERLMNHAKEERSKEIGKLLGVK